MRTEFADLSAKVLLALHAPRAHGKTGALELAFGELGVAFDVFYHDDSEFLAHRPPSIWISLPTSSSLSSLERPYGNSAKTASFSSGYLSEIRAFSLQSG